MPTPAELQRIPQPVRQQHSAVAVQERPEDTHLRSAREIMGYHIQATDGEIGHVDDFIVEDDGWRVRYVVVDTRNWLSGRQVLLSPDWVDAVDWNERKVHASLTKNGVKNSPEFDPNAPVNRQYEEMLHDYYGRPKYWA